MEKTLVLIKPDGVARKLTGKILQILEDAELTLLGMKMLQADADLLNKHYDFGDDWFERVGGFTLNDYKELNLDPVKEAGSDVPVEVGKVVKQRLVDFMSAGPIVAMVLAGCEAVQNVRRLCGDTFPVKASPGSIRGRFSIDTPLLATAEKRPVKNVIHASGNKEEAAKEVALWFPELAD